MARIGSILSQAGIVLIAVFVAAIIGVWQLSSQKIPNDILSTISSTVLIGTVFLFTLFICRVIIDGREEYERSRNRHAVNRIGDFIGWGNALIEQVHTIEMGKWDKYIVITREIEEWERQIAEFLNGYDSHLTSFVFTRSEWPSRRYAVSTPLGELLNLIGARRQKLEELLPIVAMR